MSWNSLVRIFIAPCTLIVILCGASMIPVVRGEVQRGVFPEQLRTQIMVKLDQIMVNLGALHQPTVKFYAHHVFNQYPTNDWP